MQKITLVTQKGAARALGVSEQTMCEWVKQGRFTQYRLKKRARPFYALEQLKQ